MRLSVFLKKMEQVLIPLHAVEGIPACSVLVFSAHADDEIFGCGGALIRHANAKTPISVVVVTDGAYGAEGTQRSQLMALRAAESRAAAQLVGISALEFWQFRDRELEYGDALVSRVIEAIRSHAPDLVYAPSLHEVHPDHCALSMAVVEAVRRIGMSIRLALYEVGAPLRPNLLVDISTVREQKRAAMLCFASQTDARPYPDLIEALNRYRSYTLPSGVTAAEAFELVTSQDIEHDRLALFASEYDRRHALHVPALGRQDLPLVSVIIRSMSRPSLTDALNSIARQTYPNIEVVIVDARGLAHPPLGQWCGRYPLRLIGLELALQRGQAANQGLDAASGELLIFLDDDDWFLPHHIANLKTELDRFPAAIAAYSSVIGVNQHGAEVRRFDESFDAVQLCIDNYMPIHAVLFRRKALMAGVRFDETLDLCEDWDFWLQVSQQGDFRHLSDVGAVYRLENSDGSGVWGDPARTRDAMLKIYSKWIPAWSDKTRWSIFEYARYKRLYGVLHQTQQQQITDCNAQLADRDAQLAAHQARLQAVFSSSSWRMTRPIRWLKEKLVGSRTAKQTR